MSTAGGSFSSSSLLGSNGSSSGDGGVININTGGLISASGIGSNAIFAQSIGGRGGDARQLLTISKEGLSSVYASQLGVKAQQLVAEVVKLLLLITVPFGLQAQVRMR